LSRTRKHAELADGIARQSQFGEALVITDPDHAVRKAALEHVRGLSRRYDDLVPRAALLDGFTFAGERWSLGSLQNGIYRPRRFSGAAALTLLTAAHAPGQPAPYDDDIDLGSGTILYHYRSGSIDQPDNRALRAAFAEHVPLIYFMGSLLASSLWSLPYT
jgi:hypothetical protein